MIHEYYDESHIHYSISFLIAFNMYIFVVQVSRNHAHSIPIKTDVSFGYTILAQWKPYLWELAPRQLWKTTAIGHRGE